MFKTCKNKGFSLTFENGWTISVQFGRENYCKNRFKEHIENHRGDTECENAEIAIWDSDNNWYSFGYDNAKGWCSPDEVAEWISKVSKFSKPN